VLRPKPQVVQLPVYQPGKPIEEVQREFGLTEVIKLASNENPYGCSPRVREAILAEMDNVHLYPDGGSTELAGAVAEHLGVSRDRILFGAGSDEIITMIARAYLTPGDETVMATHTFPQYKHNAQIEGAVCVEVPMKNGTHDLEAMLAAVTDRTKIVWICNPNNPTGTIVTRRETESFLENVPRGVMVVLDEAYCEYIDDPDYPNGLDLIDRYPNLVVLRTFSKIYGLASLRIGYAVGHADVMRTINQVRGPFNTSRQAQAAAREALSDQAFIAECRRKNKEQIAYLTQQFSRLGLSSLPAYGNFIMVDTQRPAQAVFEALLRRGVIVRGGHTLNFPTSIRVTVGTPEQNRTFIAALEQVLQEVSVRHG